jgi:hypothetical protein
MVIQTSDQFEGSLESGRFFFLTVTNLDRNCEYFNRNGLILLYLLVLFMEGHRGT